MELNGVSIPKQAIADFCTANHVRLLALFGSILGPTFRADSDVDVLVEFETGKGPSLLGFAGMQIELSKVFGREVHLHTPSMLGPSFRDRVMQSARVQYAA